jgi:alpha-mannosidase
MVDTDKPGRHNIRYAIYPHAGALGHHTVRAGYNFNNPMHVRSHPSPESVSSLLASLAISGAPGLIIDTVKRAEDDEDVSTGDLPTREGRNIVVRIFDSLGGKSTGTLTWGDLPVKKAVVVNLLEDDLHKLDFTSDGKGVQIVVRAFEVLTVRLQL